ncbi:hypothetical protein DLAC_01618 [Tieghemostelium lacteum]|uniref:Uncharacterized protein n=1 Tax=Tieghemostelium lacteum TaxID=361077 RepID=A0A152A5W9_TIELA|nr:hypothetical protein DLAC_01618 [Tieghemostelium lacteum]|eukprot:KYR01618.1 hypothetical protein DLAC_01618 [Tieghemostelium lacteum]
MGYIGNDSSITQAFPNLKTLKIKDYSNEFLIPKSVPSIIELDNWGPQYGMYSIYRPIDFSNLRQWSNVEQINLVIGHLNMVSFIDSIVDHCPMVYKLMLKILREPINSPMLSLFSSLQRISKLKELSITIANEICEWSTIIGFILRNQTIEVLEIAIPLNEHITDDESLKNLNNKTLKKLTLHHFRGKSDIVKSHLKSLVALKEIYFNNPNVLDLIMGLDDRVLIGLKFRQMLNRLEKLSVQLQTLKLVQLDMEFNESTVDIIVFLKAINNISTLKTLCLSMVQLYTLKNKGFCEELSQNRCLESIEINGHGFFDELDYFRLIKTVLARPETIKFKTNGIRMSMPCSFTNIIPNFQKHFSEIGQLIINHSNLKVLILGNGSDINEFSFQPIDIYNKVKSKLLIGVL